MNVIQNYPLDGSSESQYTVRQEVPTGIASGVIAESLRRSPFSVERPAPPGQWKGKLKCTISIAVAQRLRYIVSYGILSHSHSICIAFVLHCIALYGTTLYDKL